MTQITEEQQRQAARNVAAKLEAFHESLTSDEQQVLDTALRRVGAEGNPTTEDASGYVIPVGALPLIVVRIIQRLQ